MTRPDRYWERDDFIHLNREWQRRLRESGFEDLEDDFPVAHKRDLKRTVYKDRAVVRRGEQNGMAEHMRRAGRWLHERVWPRRSRKLIWRLYAEGVPRRELCRRMGTCPGHQPWYAGAQIEAERREMALYYAAGGDRDDGYTPSLLEEHVASEGGYAHVTTRGEGGGEGWGGGGSLD